MRQIIVSILFVFASVTLSWSQELTAVEIVRHRDALMRGQSGIGSYEMVVKTPRWERKVRFTAWSLGTDKSFIVIHYPKKDEGTTFLRIKSDMWQYVPKIERIIKIPPSMMLQSWMGSDFTNDDLAKESSIVQDYTHTLLKVENHIYQIASTPKPEAPVVWGKVIQYIQANTFVPVKDEFFDEKGQMIRQIVYEDIRQLPDRLYPMRWTVFPLEEEKKGHLTTIVIEDIRINVPVSEDIFSMKSLKQLAR